MVIHIYEMMIVDELGGKYTDTYRPFAFSIFGTLLQPEPRF